MTDREIFEDLLGRNCIDYSVARDEEDRVTIQLMAQTHGVEGYEGFATCFTFNRVGKLIKVGVWE